jgi:hypothetical protein
LRIRGYRYFFYSLENREPADVHVAHSGRYAKYWLDPVELASNRVFPDYELTEIGRMVDDNAAMFLEKWNEYFNGQT